ncbi:MAG: sigma-54-dependent Fis family transcriptional regulator [Deltaproteobacteria bacterium]|nr:sigma-54-dependent Fis family transcriptional regulator [Deltaproteobacteria bacterium]
MHRVLVVDDEAQMRTALYEVLKRRGYEVTAAESAEDAIARLAGQPAGLAGERFSALITDVRMPGMNGLELLRSVKKIEPGLPVLMMTAFGTIESAIEAMKEGARDYILKPFSPDIIEAALKKVVGPEYCEKDLGIVTRNPRMLDILAIARAVAASSATVLVTGESGTGKELLARFIHAGSLRRDRPFMAINCAAIPEGLLESELFGHEKGAFSGATKARRGRFEMATTGTLLLDEVGEMGLQLQAKLLRVLQEREIDRLGGGSPVPVDIRVIATTNRDLRKEVAGGRFREDLFYRLNVFPITLPPLRERPEDIPFLTDFFLKDFSKRDGKAIGGVREDARELLKARRWKGNVRELENVMERAVLLCKGAEICPEDIFYGEEAVSLPPAAAGHEAGTLRDMEKELIRKALRDTSGNRTRAARLLGISIRTLRNKLKEYSSGTRGEEIIAL